MTFRLHRGDLPPNTRYEGAVAVDTETLGLVPRRDRLCVVQLSGGDGTADVVQIPRNGNRPENLVRVLTDPDTVKIFHFARFDLAILAQSFGIDVRPVFCTKIASKLVRTYTDRHGLKDLLKEMLGVDISKQSQSSDWAAETLTDAQLAYAASDVLHLHALKARLETMLEREGRTGLAQAAFAFLPARARLDLAGWEDTDIFAHS